MASPSPWKSIRVSTSSSSFLTSTFFPNPIFHTNPSLLLTNSINPSSSSSSSSSSSPSSSSPSPSLSSSSSSSSSTVKTMKSKRKIRKSGDPIAFPDESKKETISNPNYTQEKVKLSFKSLFGRRAMWRRILFASRKVRSIILLNVVTLIYASNIPVLKEVEAIMDPAAFTVVRFGIAAVTFLPFVLRARGDVQTRNAGIELGVWVSLGYLMQALGLLTSDAGRASFISMFTVIVVPLLDGMLGAVVPALTWFGALMSIVGVSMLETSGSPPSVGDLLNFLSAVFFGVHMLRTEHFSRSTNKDNFLPLLGYEVCVIALFSTMWYLTESWFGGVQELNPSSWTWTTFWDFMVVFPWIPALYTGVFSTGFCLWIEMAAMRDVSATETAIIYGLEPVWGAGFAWFLLGERWGIAGWIGAALVLGGSLTVQIFGSTNPTGSGDGEDNKEGDELLLVSDKQNGFSASSVVVSSQKDGPFK